VRRNVAIFLSTLTVLVLLFSYRTSLSSGAGTEQIQDTGTGTASGSDAGSNTGSGGSTKAGSGTKTYTGDAVATRWGTVKVKITVKSKKITAIQALKHPDDNPKDLQINAYCLPLLAKEVLTAQSAKIDTISGATVTSNGYITSLQSALDAAHL